MKNKAVLFLLMATLMINCGDVSELDVEAPNEELLKKHVALEGPVNFREIGGYVNAEGKHVAEGVLYRADKLLTLTDEDMKTLDSLGIKTVVDFRTNSEREKEPDPFTPGMVTEYHLPIGDESWGSDEQEEMFKEILSMDSVAAESVMVDLYKNIPLEFPEQYKKYFEILLEDGSTPIVWHCTAGKDRTGIASAFLLDILAVDFETIKQDYAVSNYFRKEENIDMAKKLSLMGVEPSTTAIIMGVKDWYLDEIFAAIKDEYGSMNRYYTEALGLGEEERIKLREKYLR